MSIVSDALKKAQKEKSQAIPTGTTARPNQVPDKPSGPKINTKLLGLLVLVFIFVLGRLFFIMHEPQKSPVSASPVQPSPMQSPVAPVSTAPPRTDSTDPETQFQLTGIIFDAVSPMAVINNRILNVGEMIGEAKLVKIEPNLVRLDYKGKGLILNLR